MNAEKNTNTATIERPDDLSLLLENLDLDKELERLLNTSGQELAHRPSRESSTLEHVEVSASPSTELVTTSTDQINSLGLNTRHETNSDQRHHRVGLGKAGLDALVVASQIQKASTELSTTPKDTPDHTVSDKIVSQSPNETDDRWTGYERAHYYWLHGNLASKFHSGDSHSGSTKTQKTDKSVKARRKQLQNRKSSDMRLSTQSLQHTPEHRIPSPNDFFTGTEHTESGGFYDRTEARTPENNLKQEANSILDAIAEEKYDVKSWQDLSPEKQSKVRNVARRDLHPDRGGDLKLFQEMEYITKNIPKPEPKPFTEPASETSESVYQESVPQDEPSETPAPNSGPRAIEAAPTPSSSALHS